MDRINSKIVEMLERPDTIRRWRDRAIRKIRIFKENTRLRGEILRKRLSFMIFEKDTVELEGWISERMKVAVGDESQNDLTNVQEKIKKNQDMISEVSGHENLIQLLSTQAWEMILNGHNAEKEIRQLLQDLRVSWETLFRCLREKDQRLRQNLALVEFIREYDTIMFWINEKMTSVTIDECGRDLEHAELLRREFDEFLMDVKNQEIKISTFNEMAEKLLLGNHPERETIIENKKNIDESWRRLTQLASSKEKKIFGDREVQKFLYDWEETHSWVAEKSRILSSEKLGNDLASVQALQREHEGLKRDLAAVENKVATSIEEADRLADAYEEHATSIKAIREQIHSSWEAITEKVTSRSLSLDQSLSLETFLADFKDHVSWTKDMRAVITADELANNVEDAETLLEKNQQHKSEIDNHEDILDAVFLAGHKLIMEKNYGLSTVTKKMDILTENQSALLALWEGRKLLYEQCMNLQLFNRDVDQILTWIEKQQAVFVTDGLGDSVDSVESLQKKLDDVEKTLTVQAKKISELGETLEVFMEIEHYGVEEVVQRSKLLAEKHEAFIVCCADRKSHLNDSLKLQQFEWECNEIRLWINEKLKIANESSYLDPTNLDGKLQKHLSFEQELMANKTRMEDILTSGQKLIEWNHYARSRINELIEDIVSLWDSLASAAEKKGAKLKEATLQQQFNRSVEDVEADLLEFESWLLNEDIGEDIMTVQRLIKKQNLLKNDISPLADRIEKIGEFVDQLISSNHFDVDNIREKRERLESRYSALGEPMAIKEQRLQKSLEIQQLFQEIENGEAWIREKESLSTSTDFGHDLIGVQKLQTKHVALLMEIKSYERTITAVRNASELMMKNNNQATEKIMEKLYILRKNWRELGEKADKRKIDLEDFLQTHQYFADANETESWIQEKKTIIINAACGKDKDTTEIMLRNHQVLISDLEAFSATIKALENQAAACKHQMISTIDAAETVPTDFQQTLSEGKYSIPVRQSQILTQYDNLLELASGRTKDLERTLNGFILVRETNEIATWINENQHYAQVEDIGDDFYQLEIIQEKFDKFHEDFKIKELQLTELNQVVTKLMNISETEVAFSIQTQIKELNEKATRLQTLATDRANQLNMALEVQQYLKNVEETKDWMVEKDAALNITDIGNNLRSVKVLQRRQRGIERDLAVLHNTITQLDDTANRLVRSYPVAAELIHDKKRSIIEEWNQLTIKSRSRSTQLLDSYDFQLFLNDYGSLIRWFDSIAELIDSKDYGTDVDSIEILIKKHEDYYLDIKSWTDNFKTLEIFGELLIKTDHYSRVEMKDNLESMKDCFLKLDKTWQKRNEKLQKNLNIQLFYRDCEQMESWMRVRETIMSNYNFDGSSDVIALRKEHEDIQKAISNHEKEISMLESSLNQMLKSRSHAAKSMLEKYSEILEQWHHLKETLVDNQLKLEESQAIQKFFSDAHEIENWIEEKLQNTTGENYKDSNKIQLNRQKHEAFESELAANASRIQTFIAMGCNLKEKLMKCNNSTDLVEKYLSSIAKQFENLNQKVSEKALELKKIQEKKNYTAELKELDFWLHETESALTSEFTGNDLSSVQELITELRMIEVDITAHKERIKKMNTEVIALIGTMELGYSGIIERRQNINDRYGKLEFLVVQRGGNLNKAKFLLEFFRDLASEESWIKEKKLILGTDDYGLDLAGVQNLQKRHARLETDLEAHRSQIEKVQVTGELAISYSESPEKVEEIRDRLINFDKAWAELWQLTANREQKLFESHQFHKFLIEVEEENAWISEKIVLLSVKNYADTMEVMRGFVRKHEAFNIDFVAHSERCERICHFGESLAIDGNYNTELIHKFCLHLFGQLENLANLATQWRERLHKNLLHVQFNWKADVAESWIADKEIFFRSEKYCNDLRTVQELLDKQRLFHDSLRTFAQDNIQNLLDLKRLLVESNHDYSFSIEKRHEKLMTRWLKLVADSDARSERLLMINDHFFQIDELYRDFAVKAACFNSRLEMFEEDLTDPVKCASIEEIQELQQAHVRLEFDLSTAGKDLEDLVALDYQIKSFNVTTNPYTWFTIEALEKTWWALKRIIEERKIGLNEEAQRQIENDELKKEFAENANAFHSWMTKTRTLMMSGIGTLEDQLIEVENMNEEVLAREQDLKIIEDLGAVLERKVILDNRYTEYSTVGLAQQWDQLVELSKRIQRNLEQQIQMRKQSGVSAENLKEFDVMFHYFDKDDDNCLNHQEFKSCLRALGYDFPLVAEGQPDEEFEKILDIVDLNRNGKISQQEYIDFMISRETENVNSSEEIRNSFRAITATNRPYVTKEDLFTNLSKEMADYLISQLKPYIDPETEQEIPEALDYMDFVEKSFIK